MKTITKIRLHAPAEPDALLGAFFEHEKIFPLCRTEGTGELKPNPDCLEGMQAHALSSYRFKELVLENMP